VRETVAGLTGRDGSLDGAEAGFVVFLAAIGRFFTMMRRLQDDPGGCAGYFGPDSKICFLRTSSQKRASNLW
jgi:hypothetical protein